MRRRTTLTLLGSAVASAGCAGRLSPPVGSAADGSTRPGDGADCPSFENDADRTVCERTPGTVSLVPESDVFGIDPDDDAVESLGLTLHNDADTDFAYGPNDWTLYRQTGDWSDGSGRWSEVESGPPYLLLGVVEPGGAADYLLSPAPHPSPNDDAWNAVAELVPGRYAFAIAGGLETEGAGDGGSEREGGDRDGDGERGEDADDGTGYVDVAGDGGGTESGPVVECVATFRVEYV